MRSSGAWKRAWGWRAWVIALLVAVGAAVAVLAPEAPARGPAATQEATVAWRALPLEARQTHELILNQGPFPYSKDGIVFGNRERQLPERPRGYYREYTVPTPRSRDRGARRIVCGGPRPATPEACYYTDDHYASFRLIAP